MLSVKYNAVVNFKLMSGKKAQKKYTFFAKDDDTASSIASELFLIDEGVAEDMKVTVKPVEVPLMEEHRIEQTLVEVLYQIDKIASGCTYVEFLNVFRNFEGKNLKLGKNASFTLEFMGFKFKVEMRDKQSSVLREEITYTADGKVYVIRFGNVYYGN